MKIFFSFVLVFLHCISPLFSQQETTQEIILWHALDGVLETKFKDICARFNAHNKNTQVKIVRKGNYSETFTQGMNAFQKGAHPHLLQVYEVATQTMLSKPEVFFPVGELLRHFSKEFHPENYIDVVHDFYATHDGNMLSFPWNASTAVLYYNKEAFRKAGLNPDTPPHTWDQIEATSQELVKHGYKGFTTAWPSAYHLEHFACIHNIPFATKKNGFEGSDAKLIFHTSPHIVQHIEKLCRWQKEGIFYYGGRDSSVEDLFISQKVAMFMQGSARYEILHKKASFEIGTGPYPYNQNIVKEPYNLNIGGSSFWVLNGFSEEMYKKISEFLTYLSSPQVQAEWHMSTGYLPITKAAFKLTQENGFYNKNSAAKMAVEQVMHRPQGEFTKGVRLHNYIPTREHIIDCLEKVFHAEAPAKEALKEASQ